MVATPTCLNLTTSVRIRVMLRTIFFSYESFTHQVPTSLPCSFPKQVSFTCDEPIAMRLDSKWTPVKEPSNEWLVLNFTSIEQFTQREGDVVVEVAWCQLIRLQDCDISSQPAPGPEDCRISASGETRTILSDFQGMQYFACPQWLFS